MTENLPPSDKKAVAELCWDAACAMRTEAEKSESTSQSIAKAGEKFLSGNLNRLNAETVNGLAVDFLKHATLQSLLALDNIQKRINPNPQ